MATKKKTTDIEAAIRAAAANQGGASGGATAKSNAGTGKSSGTISLPGIVTSASSGSSSTRSTASGGSGKTTSSNTDSDSKERSTRRESTVTVPTVPAQRETEQEQNKWRELANWLASTDQTLGESARSNVQPSQWGANVALSAGKNLAGSYAGAAAVGAETLSRGMDYEGLENIERQQREEEAARITNERDAYVEASVDRGEKPDEQILAWYDQQLSDLHLDTVSEEIDAAEQSGREKRQQLYDTSAMLMQEAGEHKRAAADTLNENPVLGWTPMNNRLGETLGIADMTIGDVLTDSSTAGLEMLSDAALGAATGGGSMLPMLVRSFGAGASETAQNGGDVGEQLFQGTKQAATEWVTEHIFGGNPVYDKGKGIVDNAAEKALTRVLGADRFNSLISSAAARVMKVPAGMLEEGLEEAIGDYLNPLADSVRNAARGEGWSYAAPERGDVTREFITGALLGGMGQASSAVGNLGGNARTQETAPATAQRTGIDADIADIVDTALGVKPTENGDVEAIVQQAVESSTAETAPAAGRAAPMTLEERMADLQRRGDDWNARRAEIEQRAQTGGNVTAEEVDELLAERQTLDEEYTALRTERQTAEATQLGEQRAAAGETSPARGAEENHIDNRDWSTVGNTRIKAFQFDHPELHQYYVEAAQQLMGEVLGSQENTQRGYVPGRDGKPGTSYTKVNDSALIKKLKGQNIGTLPEIQKALQAIIDDNGQENYAVAKRVEMFLDDMLSNGYYGYARYDDAGNSTSHVEANQAYIDAKNRIAGAKTEWQKYLDDNSVMLSLGEVTEDQLADEFRAEHPDLAWQVTGEVAPTVDAQQTTEEAAGAEAAANAVNTVNAEEAAEPIAPVDVQTEQEYPGTRPTMPEPTMPPRAEGLDWSNQPRRANPQYDESNPVSKSYKTVMDSEPTSEQMRQIMDTDDFKNMARYLAKTNQGEVDAAIKHLRENGYARSVDMFINAARSGAVSPELLARGALLMKTANELGRGRDFADIYVAYKRIGTRAGQTVQASKIYQKLSRYVDGFAQTLTPADEVYMMRKTVAEYNEDLKTKKHISQEARDAGIEIDEALVSQFMNAQTEEERAAIREEILKDLGEQAPRSWVETLNSWRYFAMLFNPRTHMRNIASNLLSEPAVAIKDQVSLALQHMLIRNPEQRTQAQVNIFGKDRANYQYAKAFYGQYIKGENDGAKWYDNRGTSIIDQYRPDFSSKILNKLSKANSYMLDAEDYFHSKPAFARQMAREMKIHGISGADIEAGRADAALVQEIIQRATEYSQVQTFRDNSVLAQELAKLGRHKATESKLAAVGKAAVNTALPFKRTPANILNRAWQYSPVGLAVGIADEIKAVRDGNKGAAAAIDQIAQGLTGTGLLMVGYALAKAGHLTGGDDDDDAQRKFDNLRGVQKHSYVFGDHYISAEQLGIGSIPMLIGAEIYRLIGDEGLSGLSMQDVLGTLADITDPVFETTMLSSISDIMEDLRYSQDGQWLNTIARSLAGNLVGSFFPTLGGAIERTALENARNTTFTRSGDAGTLEAGGRYFDMPELVGLLSENKDMQYEIGNILNRVPGVDYNQIPYIDAWGREQDTGEWWERLLNSFVNPANMSENRDTGVEKVLQRLYDAGYHNVFPERASQSTEVNGETLAAPQYVNYQRTMGQESLSGLQELMESDAWKGMDDETKAKAIGNVYSMARFAATQRIDPNAESDEGIVKNADTIKRVYGFDDGEYAAAYAMYGGSFLTDDMTQEMYNAGVSLDGWHSFDTSVKALPPAGSEVLTWQKLVSASNSDMTDKQKETYYESVMAGSAYDKWLDAKKDGASMQEFCAGHYTKSYQSGSQYYVGGSGSSSKQTASGDAQTRADFMRDIAGILAG